MEAVEGGGTFALAAKQISDCFRYGGKFILVANIGRIVLCKRLYDSLFRLVFTQCSGEITVLLQKVTNVLMPHSKIVLQALIRIVLGGQFRRDRQRTTVFFYCVGKTSRIFERVAYFIIYIGKRSLKVLISRIAFCQLA